MSEDLDELGAGAGSASFNQAAANLTARVLAASDPDQVRELGLSLAPIGNDCDDEVRAQLKARLIRRSVEEPDPNLLRAIAEVAGSLSPHSSAPDVFARVFTMPDAPCQIFLERQDAKSLVHRILNPLCTESGWIQTVAAFDENRKASILQGTGNSAEDDDACADFTTLIIKDDEDEAPPAAASQNKPIELDFNKLSRALEALRQ